MSSGQTFECWGRESNTPGGGDQKSRVPSGDEAECERQLAGIGEHLDHPSRGGHAVGVRQRVPPLIQLNSIGKASGA
jgi:hypothetical protein